MLRREVISCFFKRFFNNIQFNPVTRWILNLDTPKLLAAIVVLILMIWVAFAKFEFGGQGNSDGISVQGNLAEINNSELSVRVRNYTSQTYVDTIVLDGHTEASTQLVIKAETAAHLIQQPYKKGAVVERGAILCQLDLGTRELRLLQAKAHFSQTQLDFKASIQLQQKGFAADSRVRALKAGRDAATAAVAEAKLDIERTQILAPFSGIVTEHHTKIGGFLNVGSPCVTFISHDPMLIVAHVSERNINLIKPGMVARGKLITGEIVEGKIIFVSQSAPLTTHTFKIELEVANPDNKLRAGMTAQLSVLLPPVSAHQLDADILLLDDTGIIGVLAVDTQRQVHFFPVNILNNTLGAVWVTGLPEKVRIITVGQHYVVPGQTVRTVEDIALERD